MDVIVVVVVVVVAAAAAAVVMLYETVVDVVLDRLQYIIVDFNNHAAVGVSSQSSLTKGRIAATRGRFSRIRQVAPMCTPSYICFFGPTRVHIQNGISISSVVFAQVMAESLYTLQWAAPFSPSKLPFDIGGSGPLSNTWMMVP